LGWKFDGGIWQLTGNPQTALKNYRCKIENGKIFIEIENHK
jgi:hypothetical protein